ncbi:hypothetical protein GOP47_0014798 [Adiantum capillus-veneris]|uniref:DUF7054 domain-containing protein n=1 Tax=Adiantum capillus-veneris TaxID=13818 RepID=A0A9D4UM72_ADICA|nr:hypothetical protein GOP47_0014798 [Adiantum capillus-veneris]
MALLSRSSTLPAGRRSLHGSNGRTRHKKQRPTWLGSVIRPSSDPSCRRENGAHAEPPSIDDPHDHPVLPQLPLNSLSTSPEGAPDLLQLFKIFQFNRPESTPLRMLVNVTLIGTLQSIRLLVTHDACVQDVIKASLKAYAKEGRLPRRCFKHQSYGLHYSPFCLESIDPTESMCSLMTRNFYLSPSSKKLCDFRERKAWWKLFRLY